MWFVLICSFLADSSSHTQGPLDGSLYATILKSPKSPIKTPTYPFNNNNNNNNNLIESIAAGSPASKLTQQRTSGHNLISPPPEFSNKKLIEVHEQQRYTTLNGSPYPIHKLPINSNENLTNNQRDTTSIAKATSTQSFTPTPSYEEIRIPSRSTSRDVTLRHPNQQHQQVYSHQTTPRPSSSLSSTFHHHHQQQQQHHQPDVHPRSSSVVRAASYTPGNYSVGGANQQLRTVDNYHFNTVQHGSSSRSQTTSYQDGRESVRSPLTLSMDSGISSSGIANSTFFLSSILYTFCCSRWKKLCRILIALYF